MRNRAQARVILGLSTRFSGVRVSADVLTSMAPLRWCHEAGGVWHNIGPGKPMQSGFVGSRIGRFGATRFCNSGLAVKHEPRCAGIGSPSCKRIVMRRTMSSGGDADRVRSRASQLTLQPMHSCVLRFISVPAETSVKLARASPRSGWC